MTNRLLFEAGYSWTLFDWLGAPMPGVEQPRGTPLWYVKTQKDRHAAAGGRRVRLYGVRTARSPGCTDLGIEPDSAPGQHAPCVQAVDVVRHRFAQRQVRLQPRDRSRRPYGHHAQWRSLSELHSRAASSVTVWNTPIDAPGIVDYDAAIFVQDTWTIKRLTVNPGVRIEWFSAGMRAASAEAGRFVPARFFPEERGLMKWGPDYAPALRGGVRPLRHRPHGASRPTTASTIASTTPTRPRRTRPSASSASTATGSTAC